MGSKMANEIKETEIQEEWPEQILEHKVHENNMGWLDKKFKRMAKIAKEVGAAEPSYTVVRTTYVKHMVPNTISPHLGDEWDGTFDKFNYITVQGEPPKLAGWSFIATLTYTSAGNLINKVPSIVEDIPAEYRTSLPTCDYCGLSRKRTDSFIVRNDKTGEYKQVGRNCLAKFLGYSNPERVAGYAEMLSHIGDDIGGQEDKLSSSGSTSDYQELEPFLTMVAAVVREKGWISKAKAQEHDNLVPTIGEVREQLHPPTGRAAQYFVKITPTDADKEKAREAVAFARSDKLTTDTDYKHNLKISTAENYFHEKASGVVASLIAFQDRDKEWERQQLVRKEEAAKRKAEYTKSEFVGEVGERITVRIHVGFHKEIGGQFGITHLYKMRDIDGNAFTWFSSNDVLDEGKWYNITGTVKKHETYDDIKQTVLTRCKAEEVEEVVVDNLSGVWEDTKAQVANQVKGKRIKSKSVRSRRSEPMTTMGSVR